MFKAVVTSGSCRCAMHEDKRDLNTYVRRGGTVECGKCITMLMLMIDKKGLIALGRAKGHSVKEVD